MELKEFLSLLRCPKCRQKLKLEGNFCFCLGCLKRYPIKNGRPFLVRPPKKNIAGFFKGYTTYQPKSLKDRLIKKFLVFYFPSRRDEDVDWLKKQKKASGLVLNLGGGMEKYGFEKEISLDYLPFSGVDVVADAQHIPFTNGSFDLVIADSLLEHVLYHQQLIKEIFRVLKKGGWVYARTVFLQRYHSVPYDYTRWTLEGLENLFAGLKTIRKGVNSGPWVSFVEMNIGIWRLISRGWFWLFYPGLALLLLMMAIIKPLFILIPKKQEPILASSFYYIGEKR